MRICKDGNSLVFNPLSSSPIDEVIQGWLTPVIKGRGPETWSKSSENM